MESPKIAVWLDCDPGHDDAFALLLALHHPCFQLLGISTVHGNAKLSYTTLNAHRLLLALGRSDTPVYPGASKPFCRDAVHSPQIHGESGLDGTDLLPEYTVSLQHESKHYDSDDHAHGTGHGRTRDDEDSWPFGYGSQKNAVEAMKDAILKRYRHDATQTWLVATGALTNIALLLATYPEVVHALAGLSIMGGALGREFREPMAMPGDQVGNITPWAEFNIYCDPEAARSIFTNPRIACKTTLVPLDLSHQVVATEDIRHQLLRPEARTSQRNEDVASLLSTSTLSSRLRPLYHDLLNYFASSYHRTFGLDGGPPLHDPIAVAVLLPPTELGFDDRHGERWKIDVITDNSTGQLGRTIPTRLAAEEQGVRIPCGLDTERFWHIIDQCLSRAEKALLDLPAEQKPSG